MEIFVVTFGNVVGKMFRLKPNNKVSNPVVTSLVVWQLPSILQDTLMPGDWSQNVKCENGEMSMGGSYWCSKQNITMGTELTVTHTRGTPTVENLFHGTANVPVWNWIVVDSFVALAGKTNTQLHGGVKVTWQLDKGWGFQNCRSN